MPRPRLLVGIAAAAPLALGACTFLIPFDEVASDGGVTVTEGGPSAPDVTPGDSGREAAPDGAAPSDAASGTNYDACSGALDGTYCGGGDRIPWPGRDDLVTCGADKVTNVRACTAGQGCIAMVDGYPDECDECTGKADGVYCGRDFGGWKPKNANQRIRCQGGRLVGSLLCTTCKSNGIASACQ